jgi:hypothetical protein
MMRKWTNGSRFRRDRRVRTAAVTETEIEIAYVTETEIRDVTHEATAVLTAAVTVTATATETVAVTETVTATEIVHETDFPRVRLTPQEKHSL